MLLRIAPWFSGEVVVYESLIPGGTVSFMIDGEGRALNKSRSLRGARVVPVYSKWWDSPAQGHTGPYITAGTTSTVYQLQTCTGDITDSTSPHLFYPFACFNLLLKNNLNLSIIYVNIFGSYILDKYFKKLNNSILIE